jgi:hypothetical protein
MSSSDWSGTKLNPDPEVVPLPRMLSVGSGPPLPPRTDDSERIVRFFLVRPAPRALTWRWKSSPEPAIAKEGKRKGERVTDRLEEAWNEPTGRRTETGYEAKPTGASKPMIAKLPWPKVRWRKSGGGVGKVSVLTRGDLASDLKGPRGYARGARSQQRS